MQTYDTYYAMTLQKLIQEEIERLTANVVSGAQFDLSVIQKIIGQIMALKDVRDNLMPEADKLSKERN